MYHVIGTGLTAVLLYLISYFLYKSRIFTLQFHRKLWNIVLAVTFIFTALAGILLALQINYKWDLQFIDTILKWHVEVGAGLAFAGLFHFSWHLSYYLDIFRKEEQVIHEEVSETPYTFSDIPTNLFIIGFISSSVQLLLLKEIMNITGGYELIAGAFLCSWLIGSAAGSAIAGRSPISDPGRINLWFSGSPVISVILMLLLSRLFLDPGETPSFLTGIVFTGLVLIPFCLISGFTFIKLLSAGKAINYLPGKLFSIETAGGVIAGIIISVLSAGILNTYKSLILIILLGTAYTLLTFFISGRSGRLIFKTGMLVLSSLLIISSPDIIFRQLLLRGIRVIQTKDTPYGNITQGEYMDETSTYYNQRLLAYVDDAMESEEDIHYAMLQTETTENILLISGPVASRMREIIKYKPTKVIYVESDPALIEMTKQASREFMPVLEVENDDAFSYIRKSRERFDAVIMLLPPPSSLSLNRYYTLEFFSAVKSKMNQGAVFSCSPGINPYYFNRESVNLYSSIFNSLTSVFKNVIPISGGKQYFLASDNELSTSICELTEIRNIENVYVSSDYLFDDLIAEKTREVISVLDRSVKRNTTTLPIACFFYQSFNLSKSLGEKIPSIILLVVLFAISLTTLKKGTGVMYFSALALAGYEIILLLMLQTAAGNMYQVTGLIIAGLMTGLAAGAGINFRFMKNKILPKIILLIALYILLALVSGSILKINNRILITGLLIVSGFFPAFLTGNFFRVLTFSCNSGYDLSRIYSADLAGSAVGFIVFSGLVIPLIGISLSIFLLPVLILAGFLLSAIGKKRLIY